jgi:hypothetical protein
MNLVNGCQILKCSREDISEAALQNLGICALWLHMLDW